jgi:hypothetical protein
MCMYVCTEATTFGSDVRNNMFSVYVCTHMCVGYMLCTHVYVCVSMYVCMYRSDDLGV